MMRSHIGDARELIHAGKVSGLGCPMLARNRLDILIGDGDLDEDKPDYLISL